MTVMLNIRFALLWAVLCFVLSEQRGALAQQAVPEILRKDFGSAFLTAPKIRLATPPDQTTAPIPDMEARAPRVPVQRIKIGPVFGGPATGYRGESFTSGSSTNPGLRELRMPLSGLALRLQLD